MRRDRRDREDPDRMLERTRVGVAGDPVPDAEYGDRGEYRDVPTIDEDAIAEQYATEAIESRVLDEDGDLVGHVGLFDLDEVALREAIEVAERLPDPVAVLRSSERGFHLWSLAVDGLDAWLDRADRLDAIDEEHIALSERRGCMVLRIDAKVALDDGREVRPAPRFRRFVESSDPASDPRSSPHARILGDEWGAILGADYQDLVGESAPRRTYLADIGGRS